MEGEEEVEEYLSMWTNRIGNQQLRAAYEEKKEAPAVTAASRSVDLK